MINSRNLEDLDPFARTVCNQHLANCHAKGIELIVTSTWRDFESQDALYTIGRSLDSANRRPVTQAKGGQSWHNFKCAWDVVPVLHGKPVWDERDPLWKEVIMAGKDAGAEAGADWPLFKDMCHFEVRPTVEGLRINLDEARARFVQNGSIFV